MTSLQFDRSFDAVLGRCETLSPLIRRVLCDNPGPFTFKGTSTFIIGRGRVAIIDPGPEDMRHLEALLAAVKGETVSHILITHSHADHSPLSRALQERTGAEICGYGPPRPTGAHSGERLDAVGDADYMPGRLLGDGERIAGGGWTLEAVFTPGHMSNHMAYALVEERSLFCGDHVMTWATSVIAPPDGNMRQYMESLRLLLDRDDEVYFPAHGGERRDPKPLVRATIAHRRMREEAIVSRLRAGDATIAEIVRANYADLDPRLHVAAGLSTLAHIEHLMEQGRVAAAGDGRYRLAP